MKPACSPCEQVDLVDLNSLRVHASASYLIDVHSVDDLNHALAWAEEHNVPLQVLGGGSNLVFVDHFPGLVLHMAMKGRQLEPLDDDQAMLVLKAGENWHEAVLFAARAGYRGIENLALIPGTAGAAPVQNIGAYGVELCDTLESLTALDRSSGQLVTLTAADCCFGYRDSRFKHEPGRYIIVEIRLRLSRSAPFRLGYGDLQARLPSDDAELTPLAVAQAVMAVRQEKLPDPSVLPNAGSFFKNPVVSQVEYERLQADFPGLVSYPVEQGVKLAAGWLIDQAGWKGFRNERVGVHDRQALVLINHSGGSGRDILVLAREIRASVQEKFGVALEMEPGIVGTET